MPSLANSRGNTAKCTKNKNMNKNKNNKNVKEKIKTFKHKKIEIDMNSLDKSFSELHQTKMTKSSVDEAKRKNSKILKVPEKQSVPSREIVNKTGEDLSRLLENF